MFTILIADDNINFAKLLVNDIVSTREDLRIIKIATNGKEAFDLMNSCQIDIVLLDLKMSIYNGIEVLNMLSKEKQKQYERSVIVITGEAEYIPQILKSPLVAYTVLKGIGQYEQILSKIDSIVEEKSNSMIYKKIISELSNIGYNLNHNGTKYLIDTIFEIYLHQDSFQGNLQKEIYPLVSFYHHKSIHNIKCSITRATENMVYYCNPETFNKYFNGFKPTTKTVINIILNKLT